MYPIIIRLPFLPQAFQDIYSYGLMMVLGFFAAYILAHRLFKKCGQNPDDLTNIAVLALMGGIAGARALYVIHFWDDYAQGSLWRMINVRDGGLEFYGGVVLAIGAALAYMRAKKLPVKLYLDLLAPALMLGLAFGRAGCFLNGCCYGKISNLPWAITFPHGSYAYYDHLAQHKLTVLSERSLSVHPAQLYSLALALILCAILYRFFWKRKYQGQVFVLMLILYGLARFFLEMVRTEPLVPGTGLSISQNLSIVAVVGGVVCWLGMIRKPAGQVDPQTGRLVVKKSNIKVQNVK